MREHIRDLKSGYSKKRSEAARALADLAINATNQDAIRDAQGLPRLIACLSDPESNVRHYAARALDNLAIGNATNQDAIREAEGLAPKCAPSS